MSAILRYQGDLAVVERPLCVCGQGRYCVCWESKLHANPMAVKMRGRNGSMAITVTGESHAKQLNK